MNLELLREIRQSRGMTQAEVSYAIGFKSSSGYCSIETGVHMPNQDQMRAIAKVLNMNDLEKLSVFFPD